MKLVLDAGAFVAVERGEREVVALLKRELEERRVPVTHGAVVGQVWRGGSGRQANLARLLRAVDVTPVDEALGRLAGVLLADAELDDPIDAAVVLLAVDDDWIMTSDPSDVAALASAAGLHVDVVPV